MKSTDLLRDDHRHMVAALDVVREMAARADTNQNVSESDVKCMLKFLRDFGDRHHQGKEESVLFPALLHDPTQRNYERLCCLVFEHNRQRSLIEGLEESLLTKNTKDFSYYATRLSMILREHIKEEEEVVFPLVESTLTAVEDERVASEMQHYDAAWQATQRTSQLQVLADMESKYLADRLKTA
ncbi:MAG TPA: hemerythrin domain-containing protein [Terriglobia bacterium]|nr:hemerythrin domain-containing protein [Terriglobia bacterium]